MVLPPSLWTPWFTPISLLSSVFIVLGILGFFLFCHGSLCQRLADPIGPDVDVYELLHPPYTPVPDPIPMLPPVGVQASVLSHDTIKITWADNSLPKNQKITDARYYTVRWKTNIPANTKFKVQSFSLNWRVLYKGTKSLLFENYQNWQKYNNLGFQFWILVWSHENFSKNFGH